jgi:hypothetical protein
MPNRTHLALFSDVPRFKGYALLQKSYGVSVHDPRSPDKPLYVAADMAHARRFVNAYRDGTTWAALAAVS